MLQGNGKIKTFIFLMFFFLLISQIQLAGTSVPNSSPQGSKTQMKTSPGEEVQAYKEMVGELVVQNRRISTIAIILAFIMVLFAVIIIYLERKHAKIIKKSNHLFEKIAREQFREESKPSIPFNTEDMEKEMEDQLVMYKDLLSGKINLEASPIEERLLKAEILRNSIWTLISPQIIRAFAKENWQEYLKAWNNYHKLNLALGQVLSQEDEDMWTGMGSFLEMQSEGLIPQSIWEMVVSLKNQNTLHIPESQPQAQKTHPTH